MLQHRGYDFKQIVEHMSYGTEGIYGIPTYVSCTFVFLFILFGSFLERAGMIKLFNDVALGLFGHTRGGPAQVCVASSALMGTISGSGIANVVTSGQFTIPLMKNMDIPLLLQEELKQPHQWVDKLCHRLWAQLLSSWPKLLE